MTTSERVAARRAARVLFGGATAVIGVTTWLILGGRPGWAGAAAAGAGTLALLGSMLSRAGGPPDRMVSSGVDRAFDGCVLAAIVWTTNGSEPATAAGALIALAAGFLAAYVRARGSSLGYEIDESPVASGLRYAILAIGLATGWLGGAVYTVAALSTATALVRASQVVKEERA